jgi:hypothetical protein
MVSVTDEHRGNQADREQVREDEVAARSEHPSALGEPGALILPMVERCDADDQVERFVGIWQVLGDSYAETEAGVVCHRVRDGDHAGCRINPDQFFSVRVLAGQEPENHASSASHVEHPSRCGVECESQLGGTGGDVAVHPPAPPAFIVRGPIMKRLNVSVVRHLLSRSVESRD